MPRTFRTFMWYAASTVTVCGNSGSFITPWAPMTDYLTTREAAELVGLGENYVRDLAREGRIVAIRKSNRYWIDKDSILAYVQQMKELGSQKFNWRRDDEA